jgi:ABC-type transporter Mla MlaB component
MLRITVVERRAELRLVVEGMLDATGVSELGSAWSDARQAWRGRIVIDLSGMTSIDSSGQAALLGMICEGTRLTARGAFNRYLAKDLMGKARNSFNSDKKPGRCREDNGNSSHIWMLRRNSAKRDDP